MSLCGERRLENYHIPYRRPRQEASSLVHAAITGRMYIVEEASFEFNWNTFRVTTWRISTGRTQASLVSIRYQENNNINFSISQHFAFLDFIPIPIEHIFGTGLTEYSSFRDPLKRLLS